MLLPVRIGELFDGIDFVFWWFGSHNGECDWLLQNDACIEWWDRSDHRSMICVASELRCLQAKRDANIWRTNTPKWRSIFKSRRTKRLWSEFSKWRTTGAICWVFATKSKRSNCSFFALVDLKCRGEVYECFLYATFFYVYDYPYINAMMRVGNGSGIHSSRFSSRAGIVARIASSSVRWSVRNKE